MQTRREMQLRCIAGTSPLRLTTENSLLTRVRGLKYRSLGRVQIQLMMPWQTGSPIQIFVICHDPQRHCSMTYDFVGGK